MTRRDRRPYQDTWRNGELVRAGRRDCAARYKIMRKALVGALGRGPWTVADVGGWDGYFVRRLVEDFGGQGTIVEPRAVDLSATDIRHLQMTVAGDNVSAVGTHDVILALSVFHHMDDWQAVYAGLKAQCRFLVVELAHPAEVEMMKAVIRGAEQNTEPSYEHIIGEAQTIGFTEGPSKVKRPLLLVQCAAKGTVEAGRGVASRMVAEGDFSRLGYSPYPGTLNLRVGRYDRRFFLEMPGLQVISSRTCSLYVPARIDGLDGDVHVTLQAGLEMIEILAPCRLRDHFGDGDEVTVRPRSY